MMKEMKSEVVSYKCNWCGKLHKSEVDADKCAFEHARYNLANSMLEAGNSLYLINYHCGFGWKLTEEQKDITKDNCFIVSHWQLCKKPAYRINQIDVNGKLKLWGKGGWAGYYGNWVRLGELGKPYPKEDLFIDPR